MEQNKKNELLKLFKSYFKNLHYEFCQNGITFYSSNMKDTLGLLNALGGMGAYFNMNYAEEEDNVDDQKYAITVIDFDDNWKLHDQQSF